MSRFAILALGLLAGSLLVASASPRAQDYAAIDSQLRAGQFGPVNALLVQQHGVLRFEGYYRGHDRERLQLLNSVTKSIGATLVGIAHRRGLLAPADRLETLLPQYPWSASPYSRHRQLRLEHVLSMRHGIDWDEWSTSFTDPRNPAVQMFASPDWYAYTLGRPRAAPEGSVFTYSTGVAGLMGGVLRQASGRSPQALFADWLGLPLGIEHFDWELWSPQGPGRGQRTFPFGDAPLGVGLWLRPVDLVKIGQLDLDDGVAGGERLLDGEWIARSWTRYSDAGTDAYFAQSTEPFGYGWQWWFRALRDARGREHACWYANGAGRQYLVVCPQLALVVVSTGESYEYAGPGVFTLLREQILPSLPQPIDRSLGGLYFDPAFEGQGVMIEVAEASRRVVLAWYTHAEAGQRWYVMTGPIGDDRVRFDDVLLVEGGAFMAPGAPAIRRVGTATLVWDDCGHARLDYALEQGSGEYRLQRLLQGCP